MYKSSPSDINDYIDSKESNGKELYSFEDVCDLINDRLEEAKESDADELYDYIVNNKNDSSKISKKQISNAFSSCNIDVDEKEIDRMIDYIKHRKKGENGENKGKESNYVDRGEFKEFYVEQK